MGKTLGYLSIVLLSVLLLHGCSGQDDTEQTQPHSVAQERASEPDETAEESVEPLNVTISATAYLRSDRRMVVEGKTNLPEGAQIQVVVERELSRVRWREQTRVIDGQFEVGPLGPGSGLADGGYLVRIQLAEATIQPKNVQARIGAEGEYLAGELVS